MLWIGYPTFNQFIWRQSNRTVHVDISSPWFSLSLSVYIYIYTPWTNKAPARKPSQKETIVFQPSISRCYSHACFKGVYINSKSIQALLFISNKHLWTLWHQKKHTNFNVQKKIQTPPAFFFCPLYSPHTYPVVKWLLDQTLLHKIHGFVRNLRRDLGGSIVSGSIYSWDIRSIMWYPHAPWDRYIYLHVP